LRFVKRGRFSAQQLIHPQLTLAQSPEKVRAIMKQFVPLLLCLLLGIFTVARATNPAHRPARDTKTAQEEPTAQKADAKTLLDDANKALAAMIKAARADKTLDPKTPKNKPFWKSTQLVAKNIKTAKEGLGAKNDDFFKGIAEARKAEVQMKVDWQLTDSKNKKVIESGKILGNAIGSLRTNYSKEAARKKQGGELTAKEKVEFEKIKVQQKDLLAKISKLEKSAQKDKALEKGLKEIQKQAQQITKQPATLGAYIATLYLLDRQAGLIRGYEYYADKPWRADYVGLVDWISGYDTWYYSWYDTVSYDWTYVDTSVDVHEDVTVSESISEEEISSEESYAESESFDMSNAEEEEVAAKEDTDEEVASDNDSMEGAADDEGEDMNDDDSGDAAADQDTGDDDSGNDDDGGGDENE
jgi:hypothetical protein